MNTGHPRAVASVRSHAPDDCEQQAECHDHAAKELVVPGRVSKTSENAGVPSVAMV